VPASSSLAVDAVLFDLDETLVPFQTLAHWQWAWHPQGPLLSERHVRSALHRSLHAWDRRRWLGVARRGPPVGWNDYRAHLKDTLLAVAGRTLPESDATIVVDRFLKPAWEIERFPDADRAVADLRASGIKLGVLTPLPKELAETMVRRVGLGELPVIEPEPGPSNPGLPAPGAFRSASKRFGSIPARTAFVGDLFWSDYRAALRAGLFAVLLERPGRETRGEARRIPSLANLLDQLREPTEAPATSATTAEPPNAPPQGDGSPPEVD
jgi:FMN phosphatase YigB (HAD superfamily)